MPLEFTELNSSPVVTVNCDNRKAMGKEQWNRSRLEKSTKNDNIGVQEENKNEMEIKF